MKHYSKMRETISKKNRINKGIVNKDICIEQSNNVIFEVLWGELKNIAREIIIEVEFNENEKN